MTKFNFIKFQKEQPSFPWAKIISGNSIYYFRPSRPISVCHIKRISACTHGVPIFKKTNNRLQGRSSWGSSALCSENM